jgi:hypothetical protein
MIFIRLPATPWLATFQRHFATKHSSQRAGRLSPMPFLGEPTKKVSTNMLNVFKIRPRF